MKKELKSCTGVLLRADLAGHSQFSQPADFCQKGWDGLALLGQPSKDFNWRIGDLFCPVIFLDFRTVCSMQFDNSLKYSGN